MDAALVLQPAVDAFPLDGGDDLLQAAAAGLVARQHFNPPALALGVLAVHAEQLGGEQRRFVAAGSGPDFEDDVLLIVRVLRDQQDLELAQERIAARGERFQLLLGECAHVAVGGRGELFGLCDVTHHRLILAKTLDDRLVLGQRFGELAVLGRVALHFGSAEAVDQLLGLSLDRREFIEHSLNQIRPGAPGSRFRILGVRNAEP
jgi:hypothetical protein